MAATRPNQLSVRVSDKGWVEIEKLRVEFDTDYATVMRALMAIALQHPRDVRTALKGQI